MYRVSGEVAEARREKEAWYDRASMLQQKLIETTAELSTGRGRQRDVQDECAHLLHVVDDGRKQFLGAVSWAGALQKHGRELELGMERERR